VRIGEPRPGESIDGSGLRIAVATAVFNEQITAGLEAGALDWLEQARVHAPTVAAVPGAFELPLVSRTLAHDHDAVIALGAVVLGETDHYEHVAHRASEGLMQVMLETGTPVAFGILTVRTAEHAIARSQPGQHNKGAEAAEAAVRTVLLLRTLQTASVDDNR